MQRSTPYRGVISNEVDRIDIGHAICLHEYHLCYPSAARIPTITQRGLIGPLLEWQRRKAARLASRRAMRGRILVATRSALRWVWRVLTTPRSTDDRTPVTEEIYKLYAESFKDEAHLNSIVKEAQGIVGKALESSSQAANAVK